MPRKPRFLWDYEMSEAEVRATLATPGLSDKKCFLIGRILTEARFDEILDYLDIQTIVQALPRLRLPARIRGWWEYATDFWSKSHG